MPLINFSDTNSPIPQLTLLRGVHTPDHAEPYIPDLRGMDDILIEHIGIDVELEAGERFVNKLSHDQNFVRYLEEKEPDLPNDDFMMILVWAFRGQQKNFRFVDVRLDTNQSESSSSVNPSAWMKEQFPVHEYSEVFSQVIKNPAARYDLINKFCNRLTEVIIGRDKVVVDQVCEYLDHSPPSNRIAVVQGTLHTILDQIKMLRPDISVVEKLVEPEVIAEKLVVTPLNKLLWEKRLHLDQPISPKMVDYFLYFNMQVSLRLQQTGTVMNIDDTISEINNQGDGHHIVQISKEVASEIGLWDDYTESQIAELVVQKIKIARKLS